MKGKQRILALGLVLMSLTVSALVVSGCATTSEFGVAVSDAGVKVNAPNAKVEVDGSNAKVKVDVPGVEIDAMINVDVLDVEIDAMINVDVLDVEIDANPRSTIRGSGNVVADERPVRDFQRVSLSGAGNVTITQGDEESLTVKADDNLMPYIKAEVKKGTLVIGFTKEARHNNIRPSKPIQFNLQVKKISALELSGAGNMYAPTLNADRLEILLGGAGDISIDSLTSDVLSVHLNGAGNVMLAGQVSEQDIELSGAGDYRAADLQSQKTSIALTGVGYAAVWATDTLDARISGVGQVEYYGSPHVTQDTATVGRLIRLGNR